jgi:hypothetical protein
LGSGVIWGEDFEYDISFEAIVDSVHSCVYEDDGFGHFVWLEEKCMVKLGRCRNSVS